MARPVRARPVAALGDRVIAGKVKKLLYKVNRDA